jgi:hypothetical protein
MYSFVIGAFSSILSSLDSKEAKLREKLESLENIRREYKIPSEISMKLKRALKYDHTRDHSSKFLVLNQLPTNLKFQLSAIMFQSTIKKIPFFQNRIAPFIAYICPLLRYIKISQDQYIYKEGDPCDGSNF